MWIRLRRKLTDALDGIDVKSRREGDVFQIAKHDARLLIEQGWAEAYTLPPAVGHFGTITRARSRPGDIPRHSRTDPHMRAVAADGRKRSSRRPPRRASRQTRPVNDDAPPAEHWDRIRDIRDRFEKPRPPQAPDRSAEDDIREELRDSRAKTITKAK